MLSIAGRAVARKARGRGLGEGCILSLPILALAVVLEGGGAAQAAPCPPFDQSHGLWTGILESYVKAGVVDYAGLEARGRADLAGYLRSLESVCRKDYDGWEPEEKIAFWIDAYNAYTVKLILDNYPVDSIRSIGLLPGAAFRKSFIPLRWFDGEDLSLQGIEDEILRGQWKEPRIHFAIVCASKSCPKLRSEAYRAADLHAQLEDAARGFLRDPAKNRVDPATGVLSLSSIFKWFRGDFETVSGGLPQFVARYLDEPAASRALGDGIRIEFLDYDWSLNGR